MILDFFPENTLGDGPKSSRIRVNYNSYRNSFKSDLILNWLDLISLIFPFPGEDNFGFISEMTLGDSSRKSFQASSQLQNFVLYRNIDVSVIISHIDYMI